MNPFTLIIGILYVGACIYSCYNGKPLYGALYLTWGIGSLLVAYIETRA